MRDLVTLMLITIALAWCADHVTVRPLQPGRRHRLVFCTLVILVLTVVLIVLYGAAISDLMRA